MGNMQKILIGIFLSGVLLGGIGTGIAVGEFSSLSYGGRKRIGEENLVTREMDFSLPMDGKTVILGYHGYRDGWKGSLVEDSSVPAGIVRFEITYNEEVIEPSLEYIEYEEEPMQPEESWEENLEEEGSEPGAEESQGFKEPLEAESEESQEELLWDEETEEEQGEEDEAEKDGDSKEPVYGGELYLETRYKGNDFELFMENKDRILAELRQKTLSSYDIVYLTQITVRVNPETREYVKDLFFTH